MLGLKSVLRKIFKTGSDESVLEKQNVLAESRLCLNSAQEQILSFLKHSTARLVGVEAPTGTGKTVAYLKYAGEYEKTIISTFTKSLQEQITEDIERFFPEYSYVVLKGRANYLCLDKLALFDPEKADILAKTKPPFSEEISVSSQYCRAEYNCPKKDRCEYQRVVERAKKSKIIIVNHFLLKSILNRALPENTLLVVDECHHLKNALKQEITISAEALCREIKEPDVAEYKTQQEYNKAVERYLRVLQQRQFAEKHEIKSPGIYEYNISLEEEFQKVRRVLFVSATFSHDALEVEDFYCLKDLRSWSGITVHIKNTLYKDKNYLSILGKTVKQALQNYSKTIILATNYETLDWLKKEFPEIVTTKEEKAFSLAERLKTGSIKAIAGCDTLWTGIDIPGRKCIIMTKLPFPSVEAEHNYRNSVGEMVRKFKQGLGRMLRSRECCGEVFLLDRRAVDYPDIMEHLHHLVNQGAKLINDVTTIEENNTIKFSEIVSLKAKTIPSEENQKTFRSAAV